MGSMKGSDWLLIGAAGLAAFFLFRKGSETVQETIGGISSGINEAVADLQNIPNQVITQPLQQAQQGLTLGVIGAGGTALQAVNANRYKNFAPGLASVLGNVDFLNIVRGGEYVQATVKPTASGSGLLQLRGNSGAADMIQAQYQIDQAVRAATAPTYGVSLASGGTNVFNITPAGQAATNYFLSPPAGTPQVPNAPSTPSPPAGGNGYYSPYTPPTIYTPAGGNGWYSPYTG